MIVIGHAVFVFYGRRCGGAIPPLHRARRAGERIYSGGNHNSNAAKIVSRGDGWTGGKSRSPARPVSSERRQGVTINPSFARRSGLPSHAGISSCPGTKARWQQPDSGAALQSRWRCTSSAGQSAAPSNRGVIVTRPARGERVTQAWPAFLPCDRGGRHRSSPRHLENCNRIRWRCRCPPHLPHVQSDDIQRFDRAACERPQDRYRR